MSYKNMGKVTIWVYIAAISVILSDVVNKNMKGSARYLSLLAIVGFVALVCGVSPALSATTVDLGTAGSFAVLAGSGITNTGPTTITGDIGTYPTPSETGFSSITLIGTNHVDDAVTQGAKDDLITAYNNAAGQTPVSRVNTELGTTTKFAGIYDSADGTFGITGTLTLDAQGDPSAVFIFKTASTLTTASASNVNLINGAQACNVFWQVGSSATLGTNSHFKGNILALTSITLTTGATISGRALARNGAVTLDTNTITASTCVAEQKALKLTKTASPGTYDHVGQTITYAYELNNTGNVVLSGPFTVSDNKAAVACPNTVSLNPGASIICSASYNVIQADLDAGSITNTATANAENNAVTSNQDQATVTRVTEGTKALKLTKTASPGTYDHVGQTITYAYELNNTGNVVLSGPFTVSDNKAAVACPNTVSLNPGASIICSASYNVIQADLNAGSITNTATANAENNAVTSNQDQATVTREGSEIPEFPVVALPVISVIGLMYLFHRRNGK